MKIYLKSNKLYSSAEYHAKDEITNFDFQIMSDTSYVRDDGSREHFYKINVTNGNGVESCESQGFDPLVG
jgi:hypothetical protein